MIFHLVQKNKGYVSAEFIMEGKAGPIGEAALQGKLWSMEAAVTGRYLDTEFQMLRMKRSLVEAKSFRPYRIRLEGEDAGAVYQTEHKGRMFETYGFDQMVKNGRTYDLFSLGFGEEGSKSPVYQGSRQIAQIEKDCVVYNDLHEYHIFAADQNAGLVSVLFSLYMYVKTCYEPGKKVSRARSKTFYETKNEILKGKYNPHFKDTLQEEW